MGCSWQGSFMRAAYAKQAGQAREQVEDRRKGAPPFTIRLGFNRWNDPNVSRLAVPIKQAFKDDHIGQT
jgi:hypothetical protein